MVLEHKFSDTKLSEMLGRSVGTIQAIRCTHKEKI